MGKLKGWLPLVLGVMAGVLIGHFLGEFAQIRFFGGLFIYAAVSTLFARELPVHFGRVEVLRLRGWSKLLVVVPCLVLGGLMVVYAPEVSCFGSKAKFKETCRA